MARGVAQQPPLEQDRNRPAARREALWTVPQVAAFVQLTRKGIYSLVSRGVLPFVRVGSRLRFRPDEIEDWLRRSRVRRG